jgi:formaldehyde-activating enzyme involved in methanogenesis
MIDFDGLVFGPVYETFGELAVLTIGSASYDLVVIDNTKGVCVEDSNIVGVQTIRPVVDVRPSALVAHGIDVADLIGGQIVFGATAWRIKTAVENGHELRLIVMQDD